MICLVYRVKWKGHPKWKWAVSYGNKDLPSFCFWLIPGQGWL